MKTTFEYENTGIKEKITLNKSSIERINNNLYIEEAHQKMCPTIKELFSLFIRNKNKAEDKFIVSIGNLNTYNTDLGKQNFLHVFVDTKDMFGEDKTLNFLVSNYEVLQYDSVNAHDSSFKLTDKKECVFTSQDSFKFLLMLFAHHDNYRKDWTTYHLAKECFLHKNYYNEYLQKDILDFKKPSSVRLTIGDKVANQIAPEQREK